MIAPAVFLGALALAIGLVPHLGRTVQAAALHFQDQAAYNASVLSNAQVAHPTTALAPESTAVTALTLGTSLATLAGSVVLAAAALHRRRLPRIRSVRQANRRLVPWLDGLQSGIVNDYVT